MKRGRRLAFVRSRAGAWDREWRAPALLHDRCTDAGHQAAGEKAGGEGVELVPEAGDDEELIPSESAEAGAGDLLGSELGGPHQRRFLVPRDVVKFRAREAGTEDAD